jgi:hypothetical protein
MNKIAPLEGPQAQVMTDANVQRMFGPQNALLVKQTMRGCLQECMGCEARNEYKVSSLDWNQINGYNVSEFAMQQPDIMYALEESNFCERCLFQDGRSMDLVVSEGGGPGGIQLLHFVKPAGCPVNITCQTEQGTVSVPCCCYLPEMTTHNGMGTEMGSKSEYICDANIFVPQLRYSEGGQPIYIVRPETDCGDCCIKFDCGGKGCLYIPFYFHDPVTNEVIGGNYNNPATPQIRKVWAGFAKECCTTADTFAVQFPPGISPERKAGLLGMTFLVDLSYFEKSGDEKTGG